MGAVVRGCLPKHASTPLGLGRAQAGYSSLEKPNSKEVTSESFAVIHHNHRTMVRVSIRMACAVPLVTWPENECCDGIWWWKGDPFLQSFTTSMTFSN